MNFTIYFAVLISQKKRKNYREAKYYIRPSAIYFQELFKQVKGQKLKQLAIFAKIIIYKF